jgi:hypothetical protein
MAFQKAILPDCPACKQPGLRVLESRKTGLSTRRRKGCECCGRRFTTHEVSAEFFEQAKQNQWLVQQFQSLLQSPDALIAPPAEPAQSKCTDCVHNKGTTCQFSLPEYDTDESFDCNYHQS